MPEGRLIQNQFLSSAQSMFQSPEFFRLHAADPGTSRFFEWQLGDAVAASIHFTDVGDGHWRSPARGTFGGYSCDNSLPLAEIGAFHDAVERILIDRGAASVEVLTAPQAYDPQLFANITYLLLSKGFRISQCDLNHSMTVTEVPLVERMSYGNRKRLKKCLREGLVAGPLTIDDLGIAYEAIAANRTAKGHSVSMSAPQLAEMSEVFPGRMILFGVPADGLLAAAAICLRISAQVLYVFYWGDRPGYSSFSPVVSLADCIYAYCQSEGILLLDVGTSTVGSHPQHGLIQFKRGLGFEESLKLRMTKSLR